MHGALSGRCYTEKTMKSSILLVPVLLLAAACGPTETPIPVDLDQQAGMANPASVFCEENGGTLQIRTGPDGGQLGVCIFADGSECEEWAYFRSECKPGDSLPAESDSARPADAAPLSLQVLEPVDGSVVDIPQTQVVGTTSPGAVVTVNDEILLTGGDGAFQTTVTLEEGLNLIEVVASDQSGEEVFANVTVTFAP